MCFFESLLKVVTFNDWNFIYVFMGLALDILE
jgi:hypothetical protein